MRRLYLKLYVAFLGIVVLCAFAVGASWHFFGDDESFRNNFVKGVAERIVLSLPEGKGPALEAELKQTAKSISADLTLYDADQRLIATSLTVP